MYTARSQEAKMEIPAKTTVGEDYEKSVWFDPEEEDSSQLYAAIRSDHDDESKCSTSR